jgi:PIN domain nuclease of toxin-antitoxin system
VTGLLLDTHALIWWSAKSARLSSTAAVAIASNKDKVWVSAASVYEADYKARIGRLPAVSATAAEIVRAEGFVCLPIDEADAARAAALPGDHGDPFDRLIAAQALLRDLAVVTIDQAVAAFGVRVVW